MLTSKFSKEKLFSPKYIHWVSAHETFLIPHYTKSWFNAKMLWIRKLFFTTRLLITFEIFIIFQLLHFDAWSYSNVPKLHYYARHPTPPKMFPRLNQKCLNGSYEWLKQIHIKCQNYYYLIDDDKFKEKERKTYS